MATFVNISTPTSIASSASPTPSLVPARHQDGTLVSKEEYKSALDSFRTKAPLQGACARLDIKYAKKDTLQKLQDKLLKHWYSNNNGLAHRVASNAPNTPNTTSTHAARHPTSPPDLPNIPIDPALLAIGPALPAINPASASHGTYHQSSLNNQLTDETIAATLEDEVHLLHDFGEGHDGAEELLGYAGDGGEEDEDEDEDEDERDALGSVEKDEEEEFLRFQSKVRVDAAQRAEGYRRAGGVKTQRSCVKALDRFMDIALAEGKIKDRIVDVHCLLLFIDHSATRPRLDKRGRDIPGSRVGASQLKKLFFGALRVRKVQDAEDTTLALRRPATNVTVYDAIKNRMDEALDRDRNGLTEEGDAPDIVANTFLQDVGNPQLSKIGIAFLQHRETRMCINGHVAWTLQNASGNRGDDLRALKLCELQPYTWLHPNKETSVFSILGMQGEEKAGKRGLKTKVNPVYTVFAAHRFAEQCPLGALAFYFHWVHDVYQLTDKLDIDWRLNKSWRQVRLLFGLDPRVPYNESNLYNLYKQAFKRANFKSNIKVHLPRHMLGYHQEKMGVETAETSKLGWSRGTYVDNYAPALAKPAILGCLGYKVHEAYDPVWRHVRVPEAFLRFMCPDAERFYDCVVGQNNLNGAANFWSMIIDLRPYLFQCGAAIFQQEPNSPLFRLPALSRPDVRDWMKNTYPAELARLQSSIREPVDLTRIQNESLRLALEELRFLQSHQGSQIVDLLQLVERRTSPLSPAKGFSAENYSKSLNQDGPKPLFPPVLGQRGVRWDGVLPLIKQPRLCWQVWKPSADTVEAWKEVDAMWSAWDAGEQVIGKNGRPTGVKPPLRMLEHYFPKAAWRATDKKSVKAWGRFMTIPLWIQNTSAERNIPPTSVIDELNAIRSTNRLSLNQLVNYVVKMRKAQSAAASASSAKLEIAAPPAPPQESVLSPPGSDPDDSRHTTPTIILTPESASLVQGSNPPPLCSSSLPEPAPFFSRTDHTASQSAAPSSPCPPPNDTAPLQSPFRTPTRVSMVTSACTGKRKAFSLVDYGVSDPEQPATKKRAMDR
ncbi:hypothetical protein EV714DRAFT_276343 [Schizophyllum commune]